MYRLIIAGIGVLAVCLLAVGCGGGGEDEATAQVTKAQFIKQAEKLCAKTQKQLQTRFFSEKPTPGTFQQIASLLSKEAEDLAAMQPPKAVEVRVESMTDNLSRVAQTIAREGKQGLENPQIAAYKSEAKDLHLAEC